LVGGEVPAEEQVAGVPQQFRDDAVAVGFVGQRWSQGDILEAFAVGKDLNLRRGMRVVFRDQELGEGGVAMRKVCTG
jgi:hypothetical protein